MQSLLREMNFHQAKINLLINPQECDCSKLGEIVDRSLHHAADSMENKSVNHEALSEDMQELVRVSQSIFAERWQKIQDLR
jgi:glycyl-tRNA synthetase (class II)